MADKGDQMKTSHVSPPLIESQFISDFWYNRENIHVPSDLMPENQLLWKRNFW